MSPSLAERSWPATRGGPDELAARKLQEAATALALCLAAGKNAPRRRWMGVHHLWGLVSYLNPVPWPSSPPHPAPPAAAVAFLPVCPAPWPRHYQLDVQDKTICGALIESLYAARGVNLHALLCAQEAVDSIRLLSPYKFSIRKPPCLTAFVE